MLHDLSYASMHNLAYQIIYTVKMSSESNSGSLKLIHNKTTNKYKFKYHYKSSMRLVINVQVNNGYVSLFLTDYLLIKMKWLPRPWGSSLSTKRPASVRNVCSSSSHLHGRESRLASKYGMYLLAMLSFHLSCLCQLSSSSPEGAEPGIVFVLLLLSVASCRVSYCCDAVDHELLTTRLEQ